MTHEASQLILLTTFTLVMFTIELFIKDNRTKFKPIAISTPITFKKKNQKKIQEKPPQQPHLAVFSNKKTT
jgi:hypothetical protein